MEWRKTKEWPELYEVSETGLVRNIITGKVRKQRYDHDGYVRYSLSENGKTKNRFAHRLVAEAFISNPDNLPVVHHKNNERADNRVENLEWVTSKTNRDNAYVTCPCCKTKIKV